MKYLFSSEKEKFEKITAVFIAMTIFFTTIGQEFVYAQGVINEGLVQQLKDRIKPTFIAYTPPLLTGMRINLEDPFAFSFILDSGDDKLNEGELRKEANQLIEFFLAALAIPEKDMWVNLSPYENDRIIPTAFGKTGMGKEFLAQDYILKQITAAFISPESEIGKDFWNKVYSGISSEHGLPTIPIHLFNKVWIIPDKAVLFEDGNDIFVSEARFKVMLEEDYVSLKKFTSEHSKSQHKQDINHILSKHMRNIVIPQIEWEVNHGSNFSQLRQVFHSFILAKWYRKNLRNILSYDFVDQKKISGFNNDDPCR